ncbi:MAG: multidrug effflux MFS transporter [Prevotella sp.]
MRRKIFTYGSFLVCLLGMLSAFGPFVTDMYLPALPQLQDYFSTDASMVQLSLSTSMLGLAVGQIFFGPLSDKYGRRPIVISSLWIFIVSSIACIYAPSIELFVAMRLLQGIGGSGGIVLSRSIATDRYWGEKLAKMMAIIGAINGIAPVTAPVVGGMMTDSLGWRGIFTLLMAIGVVLLIGSHIMRESLTPEKRSSDGIVRTFASFGKILRNRRFVWLLLQYGFTGGVFFSYIASSPFVIQQHYGFSPFAFSILFGLNALVFGLAAACSMKFKTPELCTHTASIGLVSASLLMLVAMLLGAPFIVYELLMLVLLACKGLCFTSTVAMAMNEEHDNAGAASALIGAIIFLFGGIVSPLVGMGDILVSTGIIFVVCSAFSLLSDIMSRMLIDDNVQDVKLQ